MDALTYIRGNLKKLGIIDVNVKKLGRGNHGTYTVGSTKPYPQLEAEKISADWTSKIKNSGKFSGVHDEKWGWAGGDDYYPYVLIVVDPDTVTKRPSKLEILSMNARPIMRSKAKTPDYGSGDGPRPEDVPDWYIRKNQGREPDTNNRLISQIYSDISKVVSAVMLKRLDLTGANGEQNSDDTPENPKSFVPVIAKVSGLISQIDQAVHVARSSGSGRGRPGFSVMIDVFVKNGVKLEQAKEAVRKAAISKSKKSQVVLLLMAQKQLSDIRKNLDWAMGKGDPELTAPRNM